MVRVVADTSALVSLGTVAGGDHDPLGRLLADHTVLVPERVVTELEETASDRDASGAAATAVLARRTELEVETVDLDETFPLDEGENAAMTLANDVGAAQLLCDEFNSLGLVHASLVDTRLVTTPTLLTALVRNGVLTADDAETLLAEMSDARSWSGNAYVDRARATLRTLGDDG